MTIVTDPKTCPTAVMPSVACPSGFSYQLSQASVIGINPQNQTTYQCPEYSCQNASGLNPYSAVQASCPKFTPMQLGMGAAAIAAFLFLDGGAKLLGLLPAAGFIFMGLSEHYYVDTDASGNMTCRVGSVSW